MHFLAPNLPLDFAEHSKYIHKNNNSAKVRHLSPNMHKIITTSTAA